MRRFSTQLSRGGFPFLVLVFLLLQAIPAQAAPPASGTSMLQSVETALAYNPALKAGQEKRQGSLHAVDKARAGFFPRVAADMGGGFSQRNDAVTRQYCEDNSARGYGDAGVRLIQPLWQGGYTTAELGTRRAQFESADSQLEDSATSLAFQAIVAHVEVLRRGELVTLGKNNVREHGKILHTVRKRTREQITTAGELHQVEGRYARAKAALSSYESALDAAMADYLNVTGTNARNLERAPNPSKAYTRLDDALNACLAGNKRIQAAMHEVTAAGGEKDMARSRFYPSINLEAGPSWHDRNSRYSERVTDVGAGVTVRWDILSGGEDMANVAMAGARIRQAKQNLHTVMDALRKDLESTYSHYLASKDQISLYAESRKSSRLAREDYYRQFLSAQRSLLDVLDAENDYFYAAGQQVMSRGDRIIAGYRLLALSGELLSSLGLDAARLRVKSPTTTEDIRNLRTAFPTTLQGGTGK